MTRILCPYCFETFTRRDVSYRCASVDESRCPRLPDRKLARYEDGDEFSTDVKDLRSLVFPAPRAHGEVKCPHCATRTQLLVCPHCHNDLPQQIVETSLRPLIIALVGAKACGKSNYLAVLLDQLDNRVGSLFNASVSAFGERTRERYREDFRAHVYDKGVAVPETVSARTRSSVRHPLVFGYDTKRHLGRITRDSRTLVIFFDTAGEDLGNLENMALVTRNLARADGLIFLLDPLQIRSVRDRLEGTVPLPGQYTEPREIVQRVTELIRSVNGLRASQRVKVPVAVAFSKMDAVRELLEQNSPLLAPPAEPPHRGFLDVDDTLRMHSHVQALVESWVGAGFDRFLRQHFSKFCYFALSALGQPPDQQNRVRVVEPLRVEDPFLWLLYQHARIDGRRKSKT
jgi:hypothetical protein